MTPSLFNRAKFICSSKQLLEQEIDHVTKVLRRNGYTIRMIKQIQIHKNQKAIEEKPFVSIPCLQGTPEKIGSEQIQLQGSIQIQQHFEKFTDFYQTNLGQLKIEELCV